MEGVKKCFTEQYICVCGNTYTVCICQNVSESSFASSIAGSRDVPIII